MENEHKRKSLPAILVCVFTLINVSAPVFQNSFRVGWVYIDHELNLTGFAQYLWYFMIFNALFTIFYAVRFFTRRGGRKANIVFGALFGLSSLFGAVFQLDNYISSVIARPEAFAYYVPRLLPWALALVGVPFLLLAWPALRLKQSLRRGLSVGLSAAFLLCMVIPALHLQPLRIVAGPLVLDTGTGSYSVVFATNKPSYGAVRYRYQDKDKIISSKENVVKRVGKIHSVLVPREELENNTYTIEAQEVKDVRAYQSRLSYGKAISEKIKFKGGRDIADPKIMSYSDWHQQIPTLRRAAAQWEAPDLVLLLGDYCDYYLNEDDVIRNVIGGGSIASFGGTVPAIFVRGNHEVRANEMDEQRLWADLGLPAFYYEVTRGNYIFTVLDSAEAEWYSDSWQHEDAYEAMGYFANQLDWLATLEPAPEGAYRLVLSHDSDFVSDSTDVAYHKAWNALPQAQQQGDSSFQSRYQAELLRLGVALSIHGHSHAYRLTEHDANKQLRRLEDGGYGTIGGTGVGFGPLTLKNGVPRYSCSRLTFRGDEIEIRAKDVSIGKDGNDIVTDLETFVIPKRAPQSGLAD
ncbi:MAG: metallophosphoesterase [Oscillospiraceae bacterium]|jgi:predicted phosphodiesterase|nr:metallophosphoesterase [Oscillospiraceae bacterium]